MGRWLAYYGSPLRLERVLYGPRHPLVEPSRSGARVGWYPSTGEPEIFTSIEPAGTDLRELAGRVESRLFLVHLRAPSETPAQLFRHGKWLWLHGGLVDGWSTVGPELGRAVAPELSSLIESSSESEMLFLLALTLGLEQDPRRAVERTVGLVEEVGRRHGIKHPFRGPIAASDGERLWAFRYSSDGSPAPVRFSTRYETLKQLYPDDARLDGFDEETRLVGSEPLDGLPGVWNDLPEATWGVVHSGQDEFGTFRPVAPVPA